MIEPLKLEYVVLWSPELGAGTYGGEENITIIIESGDPGGEPGDFAESLKDFLKNWFDASVITKEERQRQIDAENAMYDSMATDELQVTDSSYTDPEANK
jgi:hypothetical protein